MRIELPSTTWADSAHRADDDAHTLTVAPLPAPQWPGDSWTSDPASTTLHTHVSKDVPVTLTLTL